MKDLIGQRFGRLVVVERAEDYRIPSGALVHRWLCQCDCGNQVVRQENSLLYYDKDKCSCGCLAKENMSKRFKKYNEYDLAGDYGIGYIKDKEFYFDKEDYELIKDIRWKIDKDGYIVANVYNAETKKTYKVSMHRLVMNCPDDKQVDHIHGKDSRNDNRKENLRICTQQENARNKGAQKNNKSGYRGVYWHKNQEKWCAYIYNNYKRITLGSFDKLEDAVEARRKAEEEIFGEFQYNYAN